SCDRPPVLVVTANIQHGHPAARGPDAADRLAAALAGLPGDVVALQEVDKGQSRSGRVDQAAVAAAALGLPWYRFAAAFAGQVHGLRRRPVPAHVPDGAGYGVALLSRWPVRSWHVRPLRPGPVRVRRGGRLGRRVHLDPPRVLLAAVVDGPCGTFSVACTHLSTDPPTARRQRAESARALRTLPGPHLLLGDLNLGPDDAARVSGMHGPARVDTFPSACPRRQLDHVLVGPGLRAAGEPWALPLPLSDHRALVVPVVPGWPPRVRATALRATLGGIGAAAQVVPSDRKARHGDHRPHHLRR